MAESIVHAELSVLPIGTGSTSLSEYIAKGINALKEMDGIKYQVTPMGTLLESESTDKIFEATKVVMNALFSLGVRRVEALLKIDERRDKQAHLEDKLQSLKKYSV
jgi:uncharacterized protein (TIGR00106 family)